MPSVQLLWSVSTLLLEFIEEEQVVNYHADYHGHSNGAKIVCLTRP